MAGIRLTRYAWKETVVVLLLGTAAALALGFFVHPAAAAGPAILVLFFLWFCRDPQRQITEGDGLFLAPADGKVVEVEEVEEPEFLGGRAVRVAIFLSPFDVHINRAPCAGKVALLRHTPGHFRAAYTKEASAGNEANLVGLEGSSPEQPRVLVKQIAGMLARRIVCVLSPGQELAPGERFGMIKLGSRTELYVPAGRFRPSVTVGEKVRAGVTVLGTLVPAAAAAPAGEAAGESNAEEEGSRTS